MLVCFSKVGVSLTTSVKQKFQNRRRMYAIGLYEFFGGILGKVSDRRTFSPFEAVLGSMIRDGQFLRVDN